MLFLFLGKSQPDALIKKCVSIETFFLSFESFTNWGPVAFLTFLNCALANGDKSCEKAELSLAEGYTKRHRQGSKRKMFYQFHVDIK